MGIAANPTLYTPDYGSKPVTLLKGPVVSAISLVNKGANKKRFFLFKSEDGPVDHHGYYVDEHGDASDPDEFSKYLPLIKAGPDNDEWKTVYCVVAVPGEVDAQKDVWDEETIRNSAHDYLKKSRLINYMHKDLDAVGDLVESAIAPTDMKVGGEYIPKGSWFIAIEPYPEMKKMIEGGSITGVSVQGSSKREELTADNPMILSMAKGAYDAAVVPRAVTQTDYEIPESKENMEVPDDTEGPGIVMLQHILGIPETGKFDKLTRKAVEEWMVKKGVPGKPTLATIKLILTEGEKPLEEEAGKDQPNGQEMASGTQQAGEVQEEAEAGAGAGSGQPEEAIKLWKSKGPIYHYEGDSSKTPLWVVDLNKEMVTVEFPPTGEEDPETAEVSLAELYKCDNPDKHYEQLVKDHPSAPTSFGGDSYNPVDTSMRFPGGTAGRSGGLDSNSYGTHPENEGTSPEEMSPDSSDDELKAVLVRALSNGNEILQRHLINSYNINSAEQLYTYPFTQDELWGLVSRYVLGRMDNPPSQSMMMQPVRRMDRSVYGDGAGFSMQKVAPFDYHHPTDHLVDKNGVGVGEGSTVKLSGGDIATVSSVDINTGELHVEVIPRDGSGKVRIVKAKSVERAELDPHYDSSVSSHMNDLGGALLSKGVWSGSHGGHDPEAQGKIKYIVRSFGKWAKGKQHIAARKLLERGVVKTPEAANRLAAWLKDQWMNSTKWREGRKGGIHKSLFAEAYGEQLLKGMGSDEVAKAFVMACEECGHDPEEVMHMMSSDHHEGEMDQMFGKSEEEEISEEELAMAKSVVSIMRDDADLIDKLLDIEHILSKGTPANSRRTPNNDDFMAAMTALQLGLADAVSNDDLEKVDSDLEAVLTDFSHWLSGFVESGYYFDYDAELQKNCGKDHKKLAKDSSEGLEKKKLCKCGLAKADCTCENISKGWMPSGMTQGELKDGDFAWIAHDKNLPDSERRKLPYKIHGKVDPDGWMAAWKAARGARGGMDFSGGPGKEETLRHLWNVKPKGVNATWPEGMEKSGNMKGATVTDADGTKWLVTGQSGDTLSVVSGKNRKKVSASSVKVARQPIGKAETGMNPEEEGGMPPMKKKPRLRVPMPPQHGEPEGAPAEAAEPAPVEGAEAAAGAEKPEAPAGEGAGNRLARLLAAARKRRKEMEAGAAGPGMEKSEEEVVEKSAPALTAAKIDRLRETRNFLESVLNYEDDESEVDGEAHEETVSEVEAPVAEAATPEADFDTDNTEVEKDVDASAEATEVNMSDSDVTMDQIIEAINGLGEEVDGILARVEGFDALGSKLDHLGDLAKSLDSTERIDVLEQAVEKLTEALGVFTETAESVETLNKRLTALETQPGSSTAAPVDAGDHVIEKSAPAEMPLFQRDWGSIF